MTLRLSTAIRLLLVPVLAVVGFAGASLVGLILLFALVPCGEGPGLCPPSPSPWADALTTLILSFSAALAATLVVLSSLAAPRRHRAPLAIALLIVGSLIAARLAAGNHYWIELATAMASGMLVTGLIWRSSTRH